MRTGTAVFFALVSLVSLVLTAPAWAIHFASGYYVIRDTGCTIADAGDLCNHAGINLPAEARLQDPTILWFIIDCTTGADFDIEVRVNTVLVKSFNSLDGVIRGQWEVIGGGLLTASSNTVQFVASGEDVGSCVISDVILQYRLDSVP